MAGSIVFYDMLIFLAADMFTTSFIRRYIPSDLSILPLFVSGILLAYLLHQKYDEKKIAHVEG